MIVEENIKITDELATSIILLLDEKLSDNKRRAFPMPEIYKSLEEKIKKIYPDTDKYKFQKALSIATKSGQIKGYEIKLGKNGGIGRLDYKKPGTVENTVVNVAPVAQVQKEFSSLEFNGKSYKLNFSKEKLEKLLTKVFRVQEDPDGDLIFDDRCFSTTSFETKEYIDNLVFYFNDTDTDSDFNAEVIDNHVG